MADEILKDYYIGEKKMFYHNVTKTEVPLRDYYAATLAQGYATDLCDRVSDISDEEYDKIAIRIFKLTDAMIKVRDCK